MKRIYMGLLLLVLTLSGCIAAPAKQAAVAQPQAKAVVQDCGACDEVVERKEVVKEVKRYVSQCAKRVDRVVYMPICDGCGGYPVTVRRNNCCYGGDCQ